MSEDIITKKDKENFTEDSSNNEENDEIKKISDFPTMIKDFLNSLPWKLSIGMFILLLLVFSRQFTENILLPIGGEAWVDIDCPTNVGTIVLCLIASIGLIIMNMLINLNIL